MKGDKGVTVYARTYAEEFELAMQCETAEQAAAFIDESVKWRTRMGATKAEAKTVLLENLGYMAGYYGDAIRVKVETLFGAVHPIFGKLRPMAEESLELGFIAGKMGQDHARRVAALLYARYLMPAPDAATAEPK